MKRYITNKYFREQYLFNGIDNQERTDEQINYAIGVASNRVNTIVGGAITKGIREGYYTYTEADGLKLDETKFTDDKVKAEAIDATEALYEQISAMTKFAIDTGWDFLSGSFSSALGSQSDSETIDFETSLATLEKTVREALNIYDFNTILFTDEIEIAFDLEDDGQGNNNNQGWVYSGDRYLTETGLVNRLTDKNWTQGKGGITISQTIPGQPSAGITIEFTGKTGGLNWLTDDYADLADFVNNAPDFEVVKYNIGKDGGNRKGTILMKVPGPEAIEFITKEYADAENGVIKADLLDVRSVADDAFLIAKANEEQINLLGNNVEANKNNLEALEQSVVQAILLDSDYASQADGTITNTGKTLTMPKITYNSAVENGVKGELHFTNADGSISFNLPINFGGNITDHLSKNANDKDVLTINEANGVITITATQNDFFTDATLRITDIWTTTAKVDLSTKLGKQEAEAIYEKKNNEYKLTGFQKNNSGGSDYVLTNKPVGFDNLPIGAVVLLDMTEASTLATDPAQLPPDASKVFLGTDIPLRITAGAGTVSLKWGNKTNSTDPNLKDNYATKKGKFIIKNDNGNKILLFVEWVEPNASGVATWKDITATYENRVWKPEDAGKKVRITIDINGYIVYNFSTLITIERIQQGLYQPSFSTIILNNSYTLNEARYYFIIWAADHTPVGKDKTYVFRFQEDTAKSTKENKAYDKIIKFEIEEE